MGRERRHAHRHDGAFRGGQRSDCAQELIGPRPVDHPQDGVPARRQPERPLPSILGFLSALHEATPHEAVHQPARRRRRPPDRLGQLADRQRAPVGQDVEPGELGEPEAQLPELTGKTDDKLAPEGTAHGHALADLADIGQPVAGGEHGRRQVGLEAPGNRTGRRRPA